jgi:hypothetical protein
LIEIRLELIFLMSCWFWWLLTIKLLSSWALVVAIWKNGRKMVYGKQNGFGGVGGTTVKKGVK